MKYMVINEFNKIIGRYDSEIHKKIPEEAVEVTDEQWNYSININANCFMNGEFSRKDMRTVAEIVEDRKLEIAYRIAQIETEKNRPVSDLLTPELFTEEQLTYSRDKLNALQQELIALREELENLI